MHLSAQELTAAIEANIIHRARDIASRSPHMELHDKPDTLWISSHIAHPYLNRVFRARFHAGAVHQGIEEILDEFGARELPVSWLVGPCSTPPDLGNHLQDAGLVRLEDETGMALDLDLLPESITALQGLAVERVSGGEKLGTWVDIVARSFDLPDEVGSVLFDVYGRAGFGHEVPWRLFLGFLQGEPVGASQLHLEPGVAGIYHLATVPHARGRGVGTAMTLAALSEARALGLRTAVLRAARVAVGLYRELGFEEYCRFGRYLRRQGGNQAERGRR